MYIFPFSKETGSHLIKIIQLKISKSIRISNVLLMVYFHQFFKIKIWFQEFQRTKIDLFLA